MVSGHQRAGGGATLCVPQHSGRQLMALFEVSDTELKVSQSYWLQVQNRGTFGFKYNPSLVGNL